MKTLIKLKIETFIEKETNEKILVKEIPTIFEYPTENYKCLNN
jgi:hypothetical protein